VQKEIKAMEENYFQLGKWKRIPVSMHWTVLISFVWLYVWLRDLRATAIALAALFVLLLAHEFGHVLALRRRKITVESIGLYGIHGETAYGYARPADEIFVAWGGVFAQLLVLALALALSYGIGTASNAIVATISGPVLWVFIDINIVLIIIALLPIGPFDGRAAWKVIPRFRAALRRRRTMAKQIVLSPEKQRELEASSAREAAALMEKLTKKNSVHKDDA
jgi:stage IV sporulation protein FB